MFLHADFVIALFVLAYCRCVMYNPALTGNFTIFIMNILEFIRKNSILVLIVIVGIALGLIMSEYGQRSASLSGDYLIQVDGRNYNREDLGTLGEKGFVYLSSIISAGPERLRNAADADGNGQLNEEEMTVFNRMLGNNLALQLSMMQLERIKLLWSSSGTANDVVNIAITRALIAAEAERLGIVPSKEQIDTFIQTMPVFQKADGTFDQELYQRLAGFHGGQADQAQERAFRAFISDIMVWQIIQHLVSTDLALDDRAAMNMINIEWQNFVGKAAWLPISSIPAPATPSEEEIRAYWELNKGNYLSEPECAVSLYSLTPAEGISLDELAYTSDLIMEDITQRGQVNLDEILEEASKNPEYTAFQYKSADGVTHQSFPAYTRGNVPEGLAQKMGGSSVAGAADSLSLGEIAFQVTEAPTPEELAKLKAEEASTGTPLKNGIKQLRGFYSSADGKSLQLLRVDSLLPATELPYEAAKAAATADLITELHEKALVATAEKLYADMQVAFKDGGADAAMKLATDAGATVEDFDDVRANIPGGPRGVNNIALISTKSESFAPLVIEKGEGAAITLLLSRNYQDGAGFSETKLNSDMPRLNEELRRNVMLDWFSYAAKKYNLQVNEEALKQ